MSQLSFFDAPAAPVVAAPKTVRYGVKQRGEYYHVWHLNTCLGYMYPLSGNVWNLYFSENSGVCGFGGPGQQAAAAELHRLFIAREQHHAAPVRPAVTSLYERVNKEGGGPACGRVRVDMPHLAAPSGYPLEHDYQLYHGLLTLVQFPHKLPHWPEEQPVVLTRISSLLGEGRVGFQVGGYGYHLSELPCLPLAYPRGDARGQYSKALLVAGDPVRVQPDRGKPYEGTLLDTLWLNPARNEIMLRVQVWKDLSRWEIKKASIGSIYLIDGHRERLDEERINQQCWYHSGKEVAHA